MKKEVAIDAELTAWLGKFRPVDEVVKELKAKKPYLVNKDPQFITELHAMQAEEEHENGRAGHDAPLPKSP